MVQHTWWQLSTSLKWLYFFVLYLKFHTKALKKKYFCSKAGSRSCLLLPYMFPSLSHLVSVTCHQSCMYVSREHARPTCFQTRMRLFLVLECVWVCVFVCVYAKCQIRCSLPTRVLLAAFIHSTLRAFSHCHKLTNSALTLSSCEKRLHNII